MFRPTAFAVLTAMSMSTLLGEVNFKDIEAAPHRYSATVPQDRFTRLKADLEAGRIKLDSRNERAFVESLLAALAVPKSSQLLVFSTTSLQLRLITPSSPRALYFSDDLYVGYVPRGRIEIISLDPKLGAIFHIFDIPRRDGEAIRVERSERCMNCHADEETQHVPGLIVKSVVPGPRGGSLDTLTRLPTGHGVPLDVRFGGWYLTGAETLGEHWGNTIGRFTPEGIARIPVTPGTTFDFADYPAATSDLLAHLVHEHQAGFVNRAVEAGYRARTYLFADGESLTAEHAQILDEQAALLTRYLLFADEAPLPKGGVAGDADFRADFLRARRPASNGASLRDFDLEHRLFGNRCSYMIYSPVFTGLPDPMKMRVYRNLSAALSVDAPDAEYAWMPAEEKRTIRTILKETLSDLPADF